MIPAAGPRVTWQDLPEHLRAAIEDRLGSPVVEAVSQAGGFSPGTADRVVTAAGDRAFVKAVGTALNPRSVEMARAEAAVAAALPPTAPAPRLTGTVDDREWVALIFADVEGRNPRTPWVRYELDAAMRALRELARMPAPRYLPAVADTLGQDFRGWERIAAQPPADLHPWAAHHLPGLRSAAARARLALTGEALCHCDVRADNMLLRPDGTIVLVDWPHACRGPAWLDTAMLAAEVVVHGGDAGRIAAEVGPGRLADFLAACTGYLLDGSRRPDPPGLPTLRAFQRAQGDALLSWLERRAAGPDRASWDTP